MMNHKHVFSEEHIHIKSKIDPLTQIFATCIFNHVTCLSYTTHVAGRAHGEEMVYCVVCIVPWVKALVKSLLKVQCCMSVCACVSVCINVCECVCVCVCVWGGGGGGEVCACNA